jgi:hypothetical protein
VRQQRTSVPEESHGVLMTMVIVVKKAQQSRRIEQHCASRLKILSIFARQVRIYLFVIGRARIPTADGPSVPE